MEDTANQRQIHETCSKSTTSTWKVQQNIKIKDMYIEHTKNEANQQSQSHMYIDNDAKHQILIHLYRKYRK